MMRLLKQANKIICFLVLSFLILSFPVLADDHASTGEKGKLKVNIDRIGGNDRGDQVNTETELEKLFPDLFKDETRVQIETKKHEQEAWLEELQQSIFEMDSREDATIALVQEVLFTEVYTAPAMENLAQTEKSNEGASNVLLFTIMGFVSMIGGVVFMMMRQVMD